MNNAVRPKRQSQRKHRGDFAIVVFTLVLILIALVVIYSISPALSDNRGEGHSANWYVGRQIGFSIIAIVGFVVVAKVNMKLVRSLALALFVFATGLIIMTTIPAIGTEINGARRWITVGGMSLQPVELFKLAVLVYFAKFFADREKSGLISKASYTILPISAVMALVGLVVTVLQKDLGSTVSIVTIIFGMMYFSSMPRRHIAMLAGAAASLGALAIITFPHRMERLSVFLDPGSDQQGMGYHIQQAYIAIGSGGLWGKGLGQSVQVHGYLPEAANDSIFAIMAEKFGFIGCLLVLGLYVWLLMRLLGIVDRSSSVFMRLVCGGVFAWLSVLVAMNVGSMTGIAPLTGITLPLLSYGGSSMMMVTLALGLVFNISHYTRRVPLNRLKGRAQG